jgi:phage gp36-like protein
MAYVALADFTAVMDSGDTVRLFGKGGSSVDATLVSTLADEQSAILDGYLKRAGATVPLTSWTTDLTNACRALVICQAHRLHNEKNEAAEAGREEALEWAEKVAEGALPLPTSVSQSNAVCGLAEADAEDRTFGPGNEA